MKVVFMGTPDFAATALKALIEHDETDVIAVYTQPDRKRGRGQKTLPTPVKQVALEHDVPVYQPVNFKDEKDVQELAALKPDVLVVAAYGLILPQSVLDIPTHMPLNIHASLLPKYRGAAPIQRSLQNGDKATGITIMKMEAGLDTGPMVFQRALRIADTDHAGIIHDELAQMGAGCIMEVLTRMKDGRISLMQQDDALATYAAKLTKEEGLIDWNMTAQQVHNQVRAMYPWPGAYFPATLPTGKELRLNIVPGEIGEPLANAEAAGTLVGMVDDKLAIACADRYYLTPRIKPEGKKEMDAAGFVNGYLK
ncbi:MAG: methionyl-tRNA formyltransferase [Desulfovibrio sp.]